MIHPRRRQIVKVQHLAGAFGGKRGSGRSAWRPTSPGILSRTRGHIDKIGKVKGLVVGSAEVGEDTAARCGSE